MRQASLVYLLRGVPGREEVCLSRKKRKLGVGLLSGYGGELEQDETMLECAVREPHEESGALINSDDLREVAVVRLHYSNRELELHVYTARSWKPEPQESDEHGKPEWHSVYYLPFANMFPDCRFWLQEALTWDEALEIDIFFDLDGKKVERTALLSDRR